MPGSSNASFIPKHTPNKTVRSSSPKQVYVGTIFVKILFFAVLIAAAVIFFYQRHLNAKSIEAVNKFKAAVEVYQADSDKLQAISSMDKRLIQANNLLQSSVSVSQLFRSLEKTVAKPIQITNLDYSRKTDRTLSLEAQIVTDSFDSTMFQRSLLTNGDLFKDVTLKDVTIETTMVDNTIDKRPMEMKPKTGEIKFKASINIDPKTIKLTPVFSTIDTGDFNSTAPSTEVSTGTTSSGAVSVGFDNQNNNSDI